jgi:hypothetical protein
MYEVLLFLSCREISVRVAAFALDV